AQSLLLAHVPPQHPRERSSRSRMPLAFLQVTVACDHDNWICNGGSSNLLRNRMADHHTAGLAIARKAHRRKTLACIHPLQILVVDAQLLLPAFIIDRGLDARLGGGVG